MLQWLDQVSKSVDSRRIDQQPAEKHSCIGIICQAVESLMKLEASDGVLSRAWRMVVSWFAIFHDIVSKLRGLPFSEDIGDRTWMAH